MLQMCYHIRRFFRNKEFLTEPIQGSSTVLSMLCTEEEMDMEISQGKQQKQEE
jgi:hypothetical protein